MNAGVSTGPAPADPDRFGDGFFRGAIEGSIDCVRVLDPEGRLLLMNASGLAACEIDDLAPLIGQAWASHCPEPAAGEIARGLEAVRRNRTYRFEGQCPTARGTVKWWDVSLAPVHRPNGELAGIIATSRDITEARRARAEAESRADAMSAFLATMSHELRTPLNGVLGMAQAMGRGELCAVQRERLEVIETSGASLLSLLNDLLDMSKIEADQMELEEGLPLSRPPTPGLAASFRAREPGLVFTPTKLRVLAAEDNTVNQVVLKTLFSTLGIKPTLAANGQEAVSAWRAGQFDVVLMDIQMPVMDGIRAVKLIRRTELMEGRRRTPIIAVTADATAHQKAEYLAAGMDAMVAKPIAFAELLETIDAVLGPDDETPVRLAS